MEGTATLTFRDTELPTGNFVERVLETSAAYDFLTEEYEPLDSALPEPNEKNNVTLYWDKPDDDSVVQVRYTFDEPDRDGSGVDSILSLRTSASGLVPSGDAESEYTGFPATLIDLVRELAVEFDPSYVTTYNSQHWRDGPSPKAVLPEAVPIEFERLPWLGVYSERLVEQFGGRAHVLETPAWAVEELDTGAALVIKTRRPWADGWSDHPVDRHLLD